MEGSWRGVMLCNNSYRDRYEKAASHPSTSLPGGRSIRRAQSVYRRFAFYPRIGIIKFEATI